MSQAPYTKSMSIQFSTKEDIQVVAIDGKLSTVEEAAIRLKLDQKISQGRQIILFGIPGLDLQDAATIKNMHLLLQYTKNRASICALYGVKKTFFKLFVISSTLDIEKFETELEAVAWIEKVKAEKAAPKTEEKKDSSKDPEKEFKDKELQALLKTYDMNFVDNDYDPHRLTKLCEEYAKAPTKDLLQALRKTLTEIKSLRETSTKTNDEINKLSKQLHFQMSYRKAPVTASELKSKSSSITGAETAVQQEIQMFQGDVDKFQATAKESKQKNQDNYDKWQREIKSLENEIQKTKTQNERSVEEMKKFDEAQKVEVDKMKAAP